MAVTTLTVSVGGTSDCSNDNITLSDDTSYPVSGVPRADLLVDFLLELKASGGDADVALPTYDNTVDTSVVVSPITVTGYLRATMTVIQEASAVRELKTGTLATTNNQEEVTGSGTLFTSELVTNDLIQILGVEYRVASITNDTTMFLTEPYPSTASGLAYYLIPEYLGTDTVDFMVICTLDECYSDNLLAISKNNICGCEPGEEVANLQLLRTFIDSINSRAASGDYVSAQKVVEEAQELCSNGCC